MEEEIIHLGELVGKVIILEAIFLRIPGNKFRVRIFIIFLHSPSPCWDLKAKVYVGPQEYHFRVDSHEKKNWWETGLS